MSVPSKVIVQGTIQDVSEREGTSKQTGEVWRRRDALVFAPGIGVVASVGFRGSAVSSCPPPGVQRVHAGRGRHLP